MSPLRKPFPPCAIEIEGPPLPTHIQSRLDAAVQALVDYSTDRMSRSPMPRVRVAGVQLIGTEIKITIAPALELE